MIKDPNFKIVLIEFRVIIFMLKVKLLFNHKIHKKHGNY